MTQETVYIIEPDSSAGFDTMLEKRDNLGRNIAILAEVVGETVWFHDYKDQMLGGAPSVMLECSEEFMMMVKQLPGYGQSHPVCGMETERRPDIKEYFSRFPKRSGPGGRGPAPGF